MKVKAITEFRDATERTQRLKDDEFTVTKERGEFLKGLNLVEEIEDDGSAPKSSKKRNKAAAGRTTKEEKEDQENK